MVIRCPSPPHFEAVFLDEVQRSQNAIQAADDPQFFLCVGQIAGIPALCAQSPVYFTVRDASAPLNTWAFPAPKMLPTLSAHSPTKMSPRPSPFTSVMPAAAGPNAVL